MKNQKQKSFHWADVILILVIVVIVAVVHCPIKYLTGISCPGCGMTRAVCYLLLGDIKMALHCHPLVFLTIPAVLVFLFRKRLPKKVIQWLLGIAVALMLIVYLIRLAHPDEIVYIDLTEGAIYRLIQKIKALF